VARQGDQVRRPESPPAAGTARASGDDGAARRHPERGEADEAADRRGDEQRHECREPEHLAAHAYSPTSRQMSSGEAWKSRPIERGDAPSMYIRRAYSI